MLFSEDVLLEWDVALNRAVEDVEFWKGIVNMDNDRMKDEGLFRVFKWGGMEVMR